MLGEQDMVATAECATPLEVVETLTRWAEVAEQAGLTSAELVAVVTMGPSRLAVVTMSTRSFFSGETDAEMRELLDMPVPPGELVVVLGGEHIDSHITTLSGLQLGAREAQAELN